MAWWQPSNKPLSEPIIVSLLTHICVTRPQWVNDEFEKKWLLFVKGIDIPWIISVLVIRWRYIYKIGNGNCHYLNNMSMKAHHLDEYMNSYTSNMVYLYWNSTQLHWIYRYLFLYSEKNSYSYLEATGCELVLLKWSSALFKKGYP